MAEKQQIEAITRRLEPQSLLAAAIEKGASVETLEKLLALAKDVRAEQAREAFNMAFADFQRLCPAITKNKKAKIGSSYSYFYTPLEDIIEKIVPVMAPLGLSVSYRMGGTSNSVHAVAVITHSLGHFKESGEVHMPVTVGGTGANPAQCVGIAATYARRYALLAVTGISPQGEDTDAAPPASGHQEAAQPSQEFTAKHEALKRETGQPQQVVSGIGEETGVVEKLGMKKNKDGKPYMVFTFNGKSVFVWDAALHPFLMSHENSTIVAVLEKKKEFYSLVSCRAHEVSEKMKPMSTVDMGPITDDDLSPFDEEAAKN